MSKVERRKIDYLEVGGYFVMVLAIVMGLAFYVPGIRESDVGVFRCGIGGGLIGGALSWAAQWIDSETESLNRV